MLKFKLWNIQEKSLSFADCLIFLPDGSVKAYGPGVNFTDGFVYSKDKNPEVLAFRNLGFKDSNNQEVFEFDVVEFSMEDPFADHPSLRADPVKGFIIPGSEDFDIRPYTYYFVSFELLEFYGISPYIFKTIHSDPNLSPNKKALIADACEELKYTIANSESFKVIGNLYEYLEKTNDFRGIG